MCKKIKLMIFSALLTAFFLTGCSSSRNEEAKENFTVESTEIDTEDSATGDTKTIDTENMLWDYGSNLFTLQSSGTDLICYGYFEKGDTINSYTYEDFPIQPLGYTVYDFDDDGEEELLLLNTNSDYTIRLEMYEVIDEKVQLSTSIDTTATAASIAEDGYMDCMYYHQDDQTVIGIEERASFTHLGNGKLIRYTVFTYNGVQLVQEGSAELNSTFDTGEAFTEQMAALGININFDSVFYNGRSIYSYLPNPEVFCSSQTICIIDNSTWADDYETWMNNVHLDKIEASIIQVR